MTKYFTKEHEWIIVENDIATIGITNFAQEQLGDVVFVELPKENSHAEKNAAVAVVESVKSASDIYSPINGTVVEVNKKLVSSPELVNSDAEGEAWFFKLKITDKSELQNLMDEKAYQDLIK